jgi:spore germination cell wall hydrolase CwlJ-like protein
MRRRSKASWAAGVIAPWFLGMGLLVSFTASAGQDSTGDWNVAPMTARARADGGDATLAAALTGDIGLYGQDHGLLQTARLDVGEPQDLRSIPDEREPHVELKPNAKGFPQVDRTRKGDPLVAIRPSLETRLPRPAARGFQQVAKPSFRISKTTSAVALAPRVAPPGAENPLGGQDAEPLADAPATTQRASTAASPAQSGTAATPVANEAAKERAAHGATTQVSRAIALGSSTPAQPDAVPIEASAFPHSTLALSAVGKPSSDPSMQDARPDYAALIEPYKMDREKRCLAEAVYFESRSEPEAGQAAVAQVVLNRVSSGLYPTNVCGVVYQNRHRYKGCQFSFACEGKSLRITDSYSWSTAVRIADEVMAGRTYLSDVGRSTHYHANYVKPHWARSLKKMDTIGHHIFYKLKPGQT